MLPRDNALLKKEKEPAKEKRILRFYREKLKNETFLITFACHI